MEEEKGKSPNRPTVRIDPTKCIGYGDCELVCDLQVFQFRIGKHIAANKETWKGKCLVANPERCSGCRKCLSACGAHAITLDIGDTRPVLLNY